MQRSGVAGGLDIKQPPSIVEPLHSSPLFESSRFNRLLLHSRFQRRSYLHPVFGTGFTLAGVPHSCGFYKIGFGSSEPGFH